MMKKRILALLTLFATIGCVCGCGGSSGGSAGEDSYSFQEILPTQAAKTLAKEETVSYPLNEDITGRDYVKVEIKTNVHLFGQFVYVQKDNTSNEVVEDFFIEASNGNDIVEFKQFLDSYRSNAKGNFDKILKEIRFTNKSETQGTIELCSFSSADRKFPDYELELYVEGDDLKVGADLTYGGTLTYLERTSYVDLDGETKTLDEVIKTMVNPASGEVEECVYLGLDAKDDCNTHLSSNVNLINIFDAGRQFQQSFYANVGGTMQETDGENGYTRAWCTTASSTGYYWPYNPVQGGDVACNPSQIIDYEVTENELYIKTRAMDWAKGDDGRHLEGTVVGGVTTKSYMENWYTIQHGMVYVTNRFIDWNGFTDMHKVPAHSNELPAAYVVHPFNHYVCYTGNFPWTGGEYEVINNLGSWAAGAHPNHNRPEDWFAWTNDKMFGVGVYVPGTKSFASGRSNASIAASLSINRDAYQSPSVNTYLNNKPAPTSMYTSCYLRNTSYTAPVVSWTMKTYVPMSYQYVISVDYVDVMRAQFESIYESGTLKNEELSSWS